MVKKCPVCGERYEFEMSHKHQGVGSIPSHYSHSDHGKLYFHRIPSEQAASVPYK